MTNAQKKIADTIAKLLALAEDDAASDNEVDVARRKAEQLMQKHGMSADDVETAEYTLRTWNHPKFQYAPGWYKVIGAALGTFLGVYPVYNSGGGGEKCTFHIGGRPDDVEMWIYMIEAIKNQVRQQAQTYRDDNGAGRREMNAYRVGIVSRVGERLESIVDTVTTQQRESGVGLVLRSEIERKRAKASEVIHANMRTRKGNGATYSNGSGYEAGYEDGDKINVHRATKRGTRSRQLTS